MEFQSVSKPAASSYVSPIHGATVNEMTNSLGKGQDYTFVHHHAATSDQDEDYDILAVFDGHGTVYVPERDFMTYLRAAPLAELLCQEDPVAALAEYFRSHGSRYDIQTGAVASIVRIYKDRIQSFNVGDTKTLVFLDGHLAYSNVAHNAQNPAELARLNVSHLGKVSKEASQCPRVLNAAEITMQRSDYILFHREPGLQPVKLAPTQSFGHHDITGYAAEVSVIPYSPEQCVQVVVASDGLMDMVAMEFAEDVAFLATSSAQDLCAFGEQRWSQPWRYVYGGKLIQDGHSFPRNNRDDVGVATWTYRPRPTLSEDVAKADPQP